ncbi:MULTISPECIES: RolB family protein [Rhizobium/Agrobacterium group]|nr:MULTISPECIES: RolB family protein [Rhizobium/Agrobacterium group]CAA34077.1 unnamed protein product [Rhizobium rhizogenes]
MGSRLLIRPYFPPRNLCHSQDATTLLRELQDAFDSYNQSFRGEIMRFQKAFAERVLNMVEARYPVNQLKINAEILTRKVCYHSPAHDPLDLALERQQYLFIYVSCEKIQELLFNRRFLVGTEAAVATSIQPYRSELSRGEMARVHNLAWRRRQTKESDMDCFVAIFSSTLFVSWYEARAVDIYGDEVLCPFLIRQATGDRDYDVVAYGFTKFAENATSRRLPARASSFLDLKLGPPVSATDDEAADGEPTLGPGETRTSA